MSLRERLRRWWVPNHLCTVLDCDRARYWRTVAMREAEDADRLARQLQALGMRPARRVDGNEADFGHVAAGR